MITTDFAPNEDWDDAFLSLKTLFLFNQWESGDSIKNVKKTLRSFFQNSEIVLFLAARSALYNCLKSLALPSGAVVFVQGFTCCTVVQPIIANNLKPVFIDIEKQSFSMDIKSVKSHLKLKPQVLILQHTFGLTPYYREEVLNIAKKHDIFVIEDLAHGFNINLFKKIPFKKTEKYASILSFGSSKSFSSVFGGALVTPNNKIYQRVNNLENKLNFPSIFFIFRTLLYKPWAMLVKSTYDLYLGEIIFKTGKRLHLFCDDLTKKEINGRFDNFFNKKYPNALAKLLLHQLKKQKSIWKQRLITTVNYNHKIDVINKTPNNINIPLSRYPMLVTDRDGLIEQAKKEFVFLGKIFDRVIIPKGLDLNIMGYNNGDCPRAENLSNLIINLPTTLKDKESKKVIEMINNFRFNYSQKKQSR